MKHPKLSLKIDVEADIQNALGFLTYEKDTWSLESFFWGDPLFILSENFSKNERKKIVSEYVKHYYIHHKKEIHAGLKAVQSDWKKVEKRYFELVNQIFKGHAWPEGNYAGIVSIFSMYPRWLEAKTFFFPYEHQKPLYANRVIAHEMLHFMFFDYISERYGLKEHSKVKGKKSDYVWKVSEIFNVVIENWKPYVDVIDVQGKPYPGHEKMYAKMGKQWAKNQDVDWLMDQWLKR